jgi:hypothetical protein
MPLSRTATPPLRFFPPTPFFSFSLSLSPFLLLSLLFPFFFFSFILSFVLCTERVLASKLRFARRYLRAFATTAASLGVVYCFSFSKVIHGSLFSNFLSE